MWNRWANYMEATYLLFDDQYPAARTKLEAILAQKDIEENPIMVAWPILKIGMSYDLENKREKALTYYHHILEMQNGAGAQFLAQRFIAKPPKKRDPFLGY